MGMHVDIVRRETVTPEEWLQMYAVFSRYYENVDEQRFDEDLRKKTWVIQLRNDDHLIVGFSTLRAYRHDGPVGDALVLYSGDTIVDRAYRINGDLAGAFGHLLIRSMEQNGDMPIYWLLTSKGVRTYRFLPVFFKSFCPAHSEVPSTRVKALVDGIATEKFGDAYCPETQLVTYEGRRDWLCQSEHDPLLLKRSDPHVQFFLKRNPCYAEGDELVCLTEISRENLNARAWRVINHTEVNWRE